ncbi:MAG: glycoside hydrolase family 25 protein [Oscillospiraceae bacterium]|jgi:lysozyme
MIFSCRYIHRRTIALLLASVMLMSLGACSLQRSRETPDPHAGQVEVQSGNGGTIWVPHYDVLEAANFKSSEFATDGNYIDYTGKEYTALRGIDVSEHQGEIDWNSVKNDGVQFAIIRVGYRGYKQGGLATDSYFQKNIEGALAAGLRVGVYFFSQAVSADEGKEEAEYLLQQIKDYPVTLPVFFDWERVVNVGETRVDAVTGTAITDACLAFCKTVKAAGYEPGAYFYRSLGYYEYELDRLSDLLFWVGAPGSYPDFYYRHTFWQYSATGTVSGISGATDLDLWFVKKDAAEDASAAPSIPPGGALAPEGSV